jgi:hypothetical protein
MAKVYLTTANSLYANPYEADNADGGQSYMRVGNYSDGRALFILLKLPPIEQAVAEYILGLPAYNSGYYSNTDLNVKIHPVTGAWSAATKFGSLPAYDATVVERNITENVPSSSNYDYRTGYHAATYTQRYYSGLSSTGPWTLLDVFSITQTAYNNLLSAWGGTEHIYTSSGEWERITISYTAAYYDTYVKYHETDITTVAQWLYNNGYGANPSVLIRFDLPGANDTRKFYKTPNNTTNALRPYANVTYATTPAPTNPVIPAISAITDAAPTFDWSDSTDYIFESSELSYEFEFSEDGIAYGGTVTTDPGISQHTLDIKTLLSFEPGQYYHNTGCKIRVRAKTPLWGDPAQNYYSDWVESAAFTVDYRIIPNAPTVSVDNDAPYEGEGVTFTCRRPAQYNTHDSAGSINELTYQIRYGATTLADETEPVTSATKNVPYTVGELTAGTDLAVSIYARCIDTEGQESPLSAVLPMTIKRFRAPIINIAGAERGETTIDVAVDIQDTGYAGTQSNTQINKIQYNIGAGWVDATLDGWTDLSNSFTVTGIDADLAYTLQVRAVNNPPAGTALTGLTGEATSESIPEFRAAMIVFKDTVKDEKAVGVVKLYLGIEFDEELTDTDVKAFKSLTKEGWIPVADTWEYASVSGIIGIVTVPSGAQSIYRKGDAIKFTQGDPATVKKFYIISDPTDTTIQISGGTDYTLTNEAISDIYYSHIKPVDFPDAFSYTPSFSASSTMTYTVENIYFAMFCMMGGLVKVHIYADGTTGGTMSSTLLASLPIPVHDSCIYTAAAGRTSSGGVTLAGNAWVETDNNAYLRKYDSSNYTAGAGRIFIIHAEYLAA